MDDTQHKLIAESLLIYKRNYRQINLPLANKIRSHFIECQNKVCSNLQEIADKAQ